MATTIRSAMRSCITPTITRNRPTTAIFEERLPIRVFCSCVNSYCLPADMAQTPVVRVGACRMAFYELFVPAGAPLPRGGEEARSRRRPGGAVARRLGEHAVDDEARPAPRLLEVAPQVLAEDAEDHGLHAGDDEQ